LRRATGHALDQALDHRHRERRRLDHCLFAGIDLDLEIAVLAPLRADLRRIDRAELDGAVVRVADDAAGARDDAAGQQSESGRVEEVDLAFFVIACRQAKARQRRVHLVVGHRGLDLDGLGTGHGLRHLALRGLASLLHVRCSLSSDRAPRGARARA
jgi:hypothetical protein